MTTRRETVLQALLALIEGADWNGLPPTILRNDSLPVTVPANGLLILRDGDPGEPEYTMSPMTWHYRHRAEIEVFAGDLYLREATFDVLVATIGQALAADPTLGGACDWTEAEAPAPVELPEDGAAPIKAAVVGVILHYATTNPLG